MTGCLPDAAQELLLKAALLSGQSALSAWRKWESTIDLDLIDIGSQRLFPLLYRNLKSLDVSHPLMQTFKGVYRRTWYENQLLFNGTAGVLRTLEDAGIETMLLKGAALVTGHYHDIGMRPMSDLDFIVPTAKATEALHLLVNQSCTPLGIRNAPVMRLIESPAFRESSHSEHFAAPSGREFDLHWHVLSESLRPDDDIVFWEAAVSVVFQDVPTRALQPADQLLHVCFHGAAWNSVPAIRWVADAMTVIRNCPELDWKRLVLETRKRGCILEMRNTLNYLSATFNAPVPVIVLRELQEAPVSAGDAFWYRTKMNPPHSAGGPLRLLRAYQRSSSREAFSSPLAGFPRFLQGVWGLDRVSQIPRYAASALLVRAGRARRRWMKRV